MLKNGKKEKCLQEIPINTLQYKKTGNKFGKKFDLKFIVPESKNCIEESIPISLLCSLPNELIYEVLSFLTPKEILYNVQTVNKQFYQLSKHCYLWKLLNQISPIEFEYKYAKEKKIVERRSKGKLYLAKNRLTENKTLIRKVFLDVSNSEQDDGVPTSILREVSYLTSLKNPRISTILEAQVKGRLMLLAYPYYQYNLREFMQQFSNKMSYNIPLPAIKVIS